jgi:hypothetical protein
MINSKIPGPGAVLLAQSGLLLYRSVLQSVAAVS